MGRAAAGSFDLVLLDPPFDTDLAERALPLAARLVAADGLIYLEARAGAWRGAARRLGSCTARAAPARCTSICCGARRDGYTRRPQRSAQEPSP